MRFRAVKGMNDILPEEMQRWHRLETAFRRTVRLHGYQEVRVPVVEPTGLFVRSIGETTDVVDKEMYTFERHTESLTLRPEGTAGTVRAYVEHGVPSREPVTRWYYMGPMFRAERPQRGRYRQFYQAGCELFGDPGPTADAEMINMLFDLFSGLGIPELRVVVNSMGGPETRSRYQAQLLEHYRARASSLSEHARSRIEANPLRILDSKDPRDILASADAPRLVDHLTSEDREHWNGLLDALDCLGIPHDVDPRLVRGLDYYTRTLFEISSTSGQVGSQNALGGGGRYDGLVAELGGPSVPAVGFALGLERILLALPDRREEFDPFCYLAPVGPAAQKIALRLAREIRRLGRRVELDGRGRSLKAMLRRADATGARLVAVIGDRELDRDVAAIKDLVLHVQQDVPTAGAPAYVVERLSLARSESGAHPSPAGGLD